MKNLTATLHHPNGDLMETVCAMDYETLDKFMLRMARRWNNRVSQGCKICFGGDCAEA